MGLEATRGFTIIIRGLKERNQRFRLRLFYLKDQIFLDG
jgi:hypothetical protein